MFRWDKRVASRDVLLATFSFAAYDLWMLLFPLQGLALLSTAGPRAIAFWLIPHALGLCAIAFFLYRFHFETISRAGTLVTALATMAFPFLPSHHKVLLTLLGLSSAFLFVRVAGLLAYTKTPWKNASLALIIANILLIIFSLLKPPRHFTFSFLGLSLFLAFLIKLPKQNRQADINYLKKYLPFIFSFYLLISLLYIFSMPVYIKQAYLEGIEALFYILAIIVAIKLIEKDKNLILSLGVAWGILAISFFHDPKKWAFNCSMFSIQTAAGFVDVFCLYLFLNSANILRSFATGAATIFCAITVNLPLIYLEKWSSFILVLGNIILGLSLLIFYYLQRRSRQKTKIILVRKENNQKDAQIEEDIQKLKKKFSQREWDVFERIMQKKSIKLIAKELEISESSVKTYMQRIYKKASVKNKEQLIKKFSA